MRKFIENHKKALIITALLVVVMGIGAAIPQIGGDGTRDYTGAKLKAAEVMLDNFDPLDDGAGPIPGISRLRVRDVKYAPRNSMQICKDPNSPQAYTVSLEIIWWFGITTPAKTDNLCRLFGG